MNMFMIIDKFMGVGMDNLAPHKNMYNINEPRTLSRIAAYPKPVALTIATWYCADDEVVTPQSEQFLHELSLM